MKRLGGLNNRKPDSSEIGKIGKITSKPDFFFPKFLASGWNDLLKSQNLLHLKIFSGRPSDMEVKRIYCQLLLFSFFYF